MAEPVQKTTAELVAGDRVMVKLPNYFGGSTITGITTITRAGDRVVRTTAGEIIANKMSLWTICDEPPPAEAPPPQFQKRQKRDPKQRWSVE